MVEGGRAKSPSFKGTSPSNGPNSLSIFKLALSFESLVSACLIRSSLLGRADLLAPCACIHLSANYSSRFPPVGFQISCEGFLKLLVSLQDQWSSGRYVVLFSNDVFCLLVGSQAQKDRLTQLIIMGPLGELDLGDQHWIKPMAAFDRQR